MKEVELTTPFSKARGVIGRYPEPDERYVFDFDRAGWRAVHMVGVRRPLLVRWFREETCVKQAVLRPWVGLGWARADRVTEQRPTKA